MLEVGASNVMSLEDVLSRDISFKLNLLGRMRGDCLYYLGYGNRNPLYLWAKDEKLQIKYMKEIHNSLPEECKPEWLTLSDIEKFELAFNQ